MNRLYKTYLLLRKGSRQALKEYFEALLESQSDFTTALKINETQHIEFIINSDLGFDTNIIRGDASPFGTAINSNLVATAEILGCSVYPFETLITLGNVLDVNSEISDYFAELFESLTSIEEDVDVESEVKNSSASMMYVDTDAKVEITYKTYMHLITPDTFRTIITFSKSDITPITEVVSSEAEMFSNYTMFGEVIIPTLHFANSSSLNFNAIIPIEELIDVNFKTDSYMSSNLIFNITVDDITSSLKVLNYTATIFSSLFDIEDVVDVTPVVKRYKADNLTSDIIIEDVYPYVTFRSNTTDFFNTYIPVTFSLPFESEIVNYDSDSTGVFVDVGDNSIDVISQVIDGIFNNTRYKIDIDVNTSDDYNIIDLPSDLIITDLRNDFVQNFNTDIVNNYAEVFGYIETNFDFVDFSANVYVEGSPAQVFSFYIPQYSHLETSFNLYSVNQFRSDNNNCSTEFTSSFEDWLVCGNIAFDCTSFEHFDVASILNYTPTYFDSSVIVENESDAYSFDLYESTTIEGVIIDNFIITDKFNTQVFTALDPILFDAEIINTIINDTFNTGIYNNDVLDYNVLIDTDVDTPMFSEMAQYDKTDVQASLVFDDEIISNVNAIFSNYSILKINEANINVDFELDMSAYVDVIVALMDFIPTYINADFDFTFNVSSFNLEEPDLISTYIAFGDVLESRISPALLEPTQLKTNVLFDNLLVTSQSSFIINEGLKFKTDISNAGTSDMNSYFIYTTFAKLNEYNDLSYTLGSMGSSTLDELSYHRYSY